MAAALALGSFLASLLASEIVLRGLGREPKHFTSGTQFGAGDDFTQDPVLGWVNKPGTHRSFEPGQRAFTVTRDGMRGTRSRVSPNEQEILVVGGSFTFGYGVEDDETFAHVLSTAHPHIGFPNIASPGYGTVQSLLSLKRFLSGLEERPAPALVTYGFIGHHVWRNVASYEWIRSVLSRSGHYHAPPYVRIEGNELTLRAGGRIEAWPLETRFALVSAVHDLYLKALFFVSIENAVDTTVMVLAEMARVAADSGSMLLVVLLADSQPELQAGLRERDVNVLSCEHPEYGANPQLKVGTHPSAILHAYWARCIGSWLEQNDRE